MSSKQAQPSINAPRLVLMVIAAVAAIDQIAKAIVVANLQEGEAHPIIGQLLQLCLSYNPGAAFSMGESSTWLFSTLQVVAVLAVLWYSPKVRQRSTALALGLIAGGAAGNLIDRLFREPGFYVGHVVDFIWLQHFAIFNIADIAITCGVVLFILSDLMHAKEAKNAA